MDMRYRDVKLRLVVLSFLQFAVWGAYLTSMGRYLSSVGMGGSIGWFYSVQGLVSIFMPAIVGVIADRWVPAQRMLALCHAVSAVLMAVTGYIGMLEGSDVLFDDIFWTYALAVAFYMPTLALFNSVSYSVLGRAGLDTVRAFPPIRVFGTVGFVVSMLLVDVTGFQDNYSQFFASAVCGVIVAVYSLTLPDCPVSVGERKRSLVSMLGLDAFGLFRNRRMALFFLFSVLLGAALQVSNGFANTYIKGFGSMGEYAGTFAVEHTNVLISLSQLSEIVCILLIPFFLSRFGIKRVMVMAMLAWVFRFGFFALGNPAMPGVLLFVLSMLVYGVAFDFFNISGSLFVDREVPVAMRSSAQGLFMLMTNGLGASVGVVAAQAVVDHFTCGQLYFAGWPSAWLVFAGYALVVTVLFALLFKEKKMA